MKNMIFFIMAVFLLTACANKELPKKTDIKTLEKQKHFKSHYYMEEFTFEKKQIEFFEKEYENILKINEKELLEKFVSFYKKHSSYFKNSHLKIKNLEKKIKQISNKEIENKNKNLLIKALSLPQKDAINIYEKLALNGNIFAQRKLAEIYKYENKLKSIFWYKKLIENNDIKSIKDFAFANLHMISPVVVQNTKRAVKLYEKLDELGEASGLVYLANIYEYGYFKNDVPIDKTKALKYYEKAANKEYVPAYKKLAKIYSCKNCKPNRYDKQKALIFKNKLLKEKKVPIKVSKAEKTRKIEKKNLNNKTTSKLKHVPIILKNKATKQAIKKTIKCYDMKIAQANLTSKCKKDISKFLNQKTKISKVEIISLIDKNDKNFYKEKIKNKKLLKSLYKALGNDRNYEVVWHLQNNLNLSIPINISTYFISSKKNNKGVHIKFY